MELTTIGDKKTIYSFNHDKIVETEADCVGFMPDKTPVWHFTGMNHMFEKLHYYVAYDGHPGPNHGYFETAKETLEFMDASADIRGVVNEHLRANIHRARSRE